MKRPLDVDVLRVIAQVMLIGRPTRLMGLERKFLHHRIAQGNSSKHDACYDSVELRRYEAHGW